ncbi:MAG: lipid-A-disaccharide synthase [Bacteriovoracaceae bacterium]|jgi:lipid-A-disaccharide synthase|nr:lipid-A-disaccharide synthase [Bacteriovoracaceae bacterium]
MSDSPNYMNVLLIAGEKSGEEHAMTFVPELKKMIPELSFWGVGGDELKLIGMELNYHLKDFSSWGISEVISKIPFYLKALSNIEQQARDKNCKVAILIDFQDFNMRLAKKLKQSGVKVLYYVAPQAWAWKEWRAYVLGDCVHTLFTIIKFEKDWFMRRGVPNVVSISHPLWNHYHKAICEKKNMLGLNHKPHEKFQREINLLILPGSRNSEVTVLLDTFIKAAINLSKKHPVSIGIVKSPGVNRNYYSPYKKIITESWNSDDLEKGLSWADLAIATSGTVTLTCALFEVPTVVNFNSSLFNTWFFYSFVNYKGFASLANIVHQEQVFPELLGDECSEYSIEQKLLTWIKDKENYEKIKTKIAGTLALIDESETNVSETMKDLIRESYV